MDMNSNDGADPTKAGDEDSQELTLMNGLGGPSGYAFIDFAVIPEARQIQHRGTGVSYRFNPGHKLSLLGPERLDLDAQTLEKIERGARAVLNRWPQGTIPW